MDGHFFIDYPPLHDPRGPLLMFLCDIESLYDYFVLVRKDAHDPALGIPGRPFLPRYDDNTISLSNFHSARSPIAALHNP
jgi:hypothetical protein